MIFSTLPLVITVDMFCVVIYEFLLLLIYFILFLNGVLNLVNVLFAMNKLKIFKTSLDYSHQIFIANSTFVI